MDQSKTEELLHQIQAVVNNSYDAIISTTLDGVITSWNGGAERMFGYSPEEVIGKSGSSLFPPEMWAKVPALLEKIKAKEAVGDYDISGLRKDGTRFDMGISISPILDEGGIVTGASVVERDISARSKAWQLIHQYQVLVESLHDGVIGLASEGIITSWNGGAERMFGYSPEEVIGKSILLLFPSGEKNSYEIILNKAIAGEVIPDYEGTRIRKDRSNIEVSVTLSPIRDVDGKITGAVAVEHDITLRKNAERKIGELNEIRNKFIDIISHQLRTPLTIVNWNLEKVLEGGFGKLEETLQKFLQITYTASTRITRRIHDLLLAIDIEEGRIRYVTEEVVLNSICAGVVSELQKKAELKNISLIYTPPVNDIPAISGDGEKIRMAIVVLVENAIDYTKDGGKITITLLLKDQVVRFEINDLGVGIPEAEQHLIFNRFFRASNAAVMETDGFGFGLYVAKNFIEQHQGKIGFESKEGSGSTFWFEIPLKNEGVSSP